MNKKNILIGILSFIVLSLNAQSDNGSYTGIKKLIDENISRIEAKTIEWRRYFHEHPELSNQEYKTAAYIAKQLEEMGLEVKTGIAKTGVTALLRGGMEGPVVALRADMDALPVTEELDLPFSSKVRTIYNGKETGVMHACGHDAHMAILLATADVLSSVRDLLPGSVKFIFQPAEEGAFEEKTWGAELMIREGVLADPKPDVIFGLHVWPLPSGEIGYNEQAIMASVDNFRIVVMGKGTHGALPWQGVDPILAASAIVLNIQGIISRNVELTEGAAVITVGSINGGNRNNIIPDQVEMLGTIRTHSRETRELVHRRLDEVVKNTASAYGAEAELIIDILYPATINNKELSKLMIPSLQKAAGEENVLHVNPVMPAEDFSFYLQKIPGMYFFLGIIPNDTTPENIEANHSPRFNIDENALHTGVKAFSYLVIDYLFQYNK